MCDKCLLRAKRTPIFNLQLQLERTLQGYSKADLKDPEVAAYIGIMYNTLADTMRVIESNKKVEK